MSSSNFAANSVSEEMEKKFFFSLNYVLFLFTQNFTSSLI